MARNRGRHSRPSTTAALAHNVRRGTAVAVGTGGLAALTVVHPAGAQAAPVAAWDAVALCESGNRNVNNASGPGGTPASTASGFWQIINGTWDGFGGEEFGDRAIDATREQQLVIAERVLAAQGPGAWGACGVPLRGLPATDRSAPAPVPVTPVPVPEPPAAGPPAEAPTAELPAVPADRVHAEFTHTVAAGDWLSQIALDRGICAPADDVATCWSDFAAQNADVAPDPDVILPGQQLRYAGLVLASAPVPAAAEYEAVLTDPEVAEQAAEQTVEQAGVATVVHPVPEATRRDGLGAGRSHMGVDLAAPLGTGIHAAVGGTVISSGSANGFGNWIRIRSADNVVFVYGHMRAEDLFVGVGDVVRAGDLISAVGSEGRSTGAHLHFEVRPNGGAAIDPIAYLAALGVAL